MSRFHSAIADCFHYKSRTFKVNLYDRFQRAHAKWERKSCTVEVSYHLEAPEDSSQDCEKCEVSDEPLTEDPRSSLTLFPTMSLAGLWLSLVPGEWIRLRDMGLRYPCDSCAPIGLKLCIVLFWYYIRVFAKFGVERPIERWLKTKP
jgi:hypothetical protein